MSILESLASNFGTLLLALIAYKSGLLRFLINGRYWNGKKTTEGKIDELKDNHFSELKDNQEKIIHLLEEFKEYGIKLRK